jgi:hypothetical protein
MKNYLKILSRIIAPNVSKQDSQIDTSCQNVSAPAEPQGRIHEILGQPSSKTKETNVITPKNDDGEWGHAYVLLDVSGSMEHGYGSPLYHAAMGTYAFAYDAITRHKYKVGIILFSNKYHVLTHPTNDLMATSYALNAERIYEKCGGSTDMSHSFVHACTSLYDMCLKSKNKRKAIIAATDWETREYYRGRTFRNRLPDGRYEYYCEEPVEYYYTESNVIRLFMEDSAVSATYSEQALIGLLENFKGFIDTTEFISISIPGTTRTPPPLFSRNDIKAIKGEDLTPAIASAAKLLP